MGPLFRSTPIAEVPQLSSLRQRYFELRRVHGDTLWETLDGQQLEMAMERDDLCEILPYGDEEKFPFGCMSTLALYWDLIDHLEFGSREILIVGERGSGKEVIAKVIASKLGLKLVSMNCATLVESVAESLLFGVAPKSGIANVPAQGTPGIVGEADGNVLFLDEIFDAPASVLPKLLRLLQQPREYLRVGDSKATTLKPNTVIVAASNRHPDRRSLDDAARSGNVRADLLDRFGYIAEVPPLRMRKKELPTIAEEVFRTLLRRRSITTLTGIGSDTLAMLRHHPYEWPGNIRELTRLIEEHVRLARYSIEHTAGKMEHLEIPKSVLDRLQDRIVSAALSGTTASAHGSQLEEKEMLVKLLTEKMRSENLTKVDKNWVGKHCREIINMNRKTPISNIGEYLKGHYGCTCSEIAARLSET